jgi:hypothetical protein
VGTFILKGTLTVEEDCSEGPIGKVPDQVDLHTTLYFSNATPIPMKVTVQLKDIGAGFKKVGDYEFKQYTKIGELGTEWQYPVVTRVGGDPLVEADWVCRVINSCRPGTEPCYNIAQATKIIFSNTGVHGCMEWRDIKVTCVCKGGN